MSLRQASRTKQYVVVHIVRHGWALPCGVTAQLSTFYRKYCGSHMLEAVLKLTDRLKDAMLSFAKCTHRD